MEKAQHFRGAEFTLDGLSLITAQADDSTAAHYINGRKEMTVHVQLWTLNVEALRAWFLRGENVPISAHDAFKGAAQTIIRNAALYNDGGFDVSSKGDLVCAVRFIPDEDTEAQAEDGVSKVAKFPRSSRGRGRARSWHRSIARSVFDKEEEPKSNGRFELVCASIAVGSIGKIVQSVQLSKAEATGITSVKFSPTADYIVLGRGRRSCNDTSAQEETRGSSEEASSKSAVVSIYKRFGNDEVGADMTLFSEIHSAEDAANIALFNPLPGHGLAYGTQKGLVKIFRRAPLR